MLRDGAGMVTEYFSVIWLGDEADHLGVVPSDPSWQTFWEFATLLLCLCTWGDRFTSETLTIYGDNTAALDLALSYKGTGAMAAVSRELSWRQARRGWSFCVAHLPAEHNTAADSLSRVADPKGTTWPAVALASAEVATPPKLKDLWLAVPY